MADPRDSTQRNPALDDRGGDRDPTIVGIGASAGGLAALRELFAHVPADNDLAWVVVVHLSPEHESHLAALLQPQVRMPVQQVGETVPIEAGRVYVIPPNANLEAIDTHLRLSQLEERRRERAPIDHFFRTLSRTHDGHAVGVVLSGTGGDGTIGLKEIKEKGGLSVVQDPDEAEYDGMPRSAVATGLVDLILPLAEIPGAILRYAHTRPRLTMPPEGAEPEDDERVLLQKVFAQIRAHTGRDFSRYKRSTILRRTARRMQIRQVEELSRYLDVLRADPEEVRALAEDLLITVTNFFRDSEVFEVLEREVVPQLFEGKSPDDEIRVWTVGCATGEEAYSLAMLLVEEAGRRADPPRVQIFASDLHERSLEKARAGFYPGEIEQDVSPARLKRFFEKENGAYRIRKELRELVVFAPHNVMGDPPFSRIDLISCRNLLIYLRREVQPDVVALFHYALNPDGFLVLGTSEGVEAPDLFRIEQKKECIYRKRNVRAPESTLPVFPDTTRRLVDGARRRTGPVEPGTHGTVHQRLLERYAPPSLLIAPDDRVVHLSEGAGRYLVHPRGDVTANVYQLVRQELRIPLRAAIHEARERRRRLQSPPVAVRFNGESGEVLVHVLPSESPEEDGFALVLFEEQRMVPSPPAGLPDVGTEDSGTASRVEGLEAELDHSRRTLQAIIEDYETSQEELRASNEELQSSNEELRSTMEELETGKEELQSMNEELHTVNQENRHKVAELAQLSADLQNLMAATEIATLFLDRDLRILRFTPNVAEVFNVRVTDHGRPLTDITHRLGSDRISADAEQVLDTLKPVEREVQDEGGRWHLSRVLPYRDTRDRVEGVVVTLVEITRLKEAQGALEESERQLRATAASLVEERSRLEAVLRSLPVGVWVADDEGRMIMKKEAADRIWAGEAPLADGVEQYEAYAAWHPETGERLGPRDYPVARALETREPVKAVELDIERFDGTHGAVLVSAAPVLDEDGGVIGVVGIGLDITDRRLTEQTLRKAKAAAEDAARAKTLFLSTLSHELRTPLNAVIGFADVLLEGLAGPVNDKQTDLLARIRSSAWYQLSMIEEILSFSRAETGEGEVLIDRIDMAEVAREIVGMLGQEAVRKGLDVRLETGDAPLPLVTDTRKVRQILTNLLGNAIKFTSEGHIDVELACSEESVVVTVRDTGRGIPEDRLADVFDPFVQIDASHTREEGGTGLGLAVSRRLARLLGGDVDVESEVGKGSTFLLRLPRRETSEDDPPGSAS